MFIKIGETLINPERVDSIRFTGGVADVSVNGEAFRFESGEAETLRKALMKEGISRDLGPLGVADILRECRAVPVDGPLARSVSTSHTGS